MNSFLTAIFFSFLLLAGCAATADERLARQPDTEEEAESVLDEDLAGGIDFDRYRSRLSDHFAYVDNEIPDVFRTTETDASTLDGNNGFRIQLVSTTDKMLADSLALSFEMWADTAGFDQRPMSYIQFRTPAYRVHVGDFYSRRLAIEYLGVIRRYFPGSWVVHDRIDTGNVIQ
jgi:hypothetical protein